MILKKSAAVCVLIAAAATLASAEINFDGPSNTSLRQEMDNLGLKPPKAVPVEVKGQANLSSGVPKEWTVMVYINGKNDLERFALMDVNEMESIGSSDKVSVVVELGRMDGYDASDGDWKGSRRYLIQKDNDADKITSPVLQDLGKVDMGDYRHLIDFAKWGMAAYPAKKYMLIVWNHGSGWVKTTGAFESKGISYDEESGNNFTAPQLGMALKAMGKIDIYGSDACLMQMAEVAYELKDSVDFIVGSEEIEPNDGYTYNNLLGPLVADPAMSAEVLGRLAVDAYADHYQAKNEGYTSSLLRTSAMPRLLTLTNDFVAAMMNTGDAVQVKAAVSRTQRYVFGDNRDMWHVADQVASGTKSASVRAAAEALKDHISNNLIVHNRVHASYANSHGLAVYGPMYYYNLNYNKLPWTAASKWGELIGWYLKTDSPW